MISDKDRSALQHQLNGKKRYYSIHPEWLDDSNTFIEYCIQNDWKSGQTIKVIDKSLDVQFAPDNIEFKTFDIHPTSKEGGFLQRDGHARPRNILVWPTSLANIFLIPFLSYISDCQSTNKNR